MRNIVITILLGLSLTIVGCSKKSKTEAKAKQTDKAKPAANADDRPRPGLRSRKRRRIDPTVRAKRLQARLKLTDDQTAKLEKVLESTPRSEQRDKMKEIFTDDQWKQLNTRRGGRFGRSFKMTADRRAKFMKSAFGLDDTQATKLAEILRTTPRKDRQAAVEKLLTPEQLKLWNKARKGRGKMRRQPGGGFGKSPNVPAPPSSK